MSTGAVCALLAIALASGAFVIQGHFGVNLSDEGHLWYVTGRTALGDVPLRDVRAYDPARYYWGAVGFHVLGPGLVSLRLGLSVVRAVGLFFGLLVLRRVVRRWWLLAILGAVLVLWMHPLYKAWESLPVLGFAWLFVRLLEAPSTRRHFAAGLGVGLGAMIRVDHGLYGAAGLALLVMFMVVRGRRVGRTELAATGLGVLAGYAPMLAMLAVVPGFARGFAEHLGYLAGIVAWGGNTNLRIPVPWPWHALRPMPPLDRAYVASIGLLFLAVPAAYVAALAMVARSPADETPPRRVLVAAGLAGIMYVHYAFSRADLPHLAPSVHALVMVAAAVVACLGARWRAAVAGAGIGLLTAVTALTVGLSTPLYLRAVKDPDPFVPTRVAGDTLWVRASTAQFLAVTRSATEQLLGPGERLLILPYWPGLYAVLGRESPLWETYFVYPESEERQRRMIADMERRNASLVLYADFLIDNRADLHFSRTHAVVYRHLVEQFEEIRVPGLVSWVHLLRRKAAPADARPRS